MSDTLDGTTMPETVDVTTIGDTIDVTTVSDTVDVTAVSDTVDVTAVSDTVDVTTIGDMVDDTTIGDTVDDTTIGDTVDVTTIGDTQDVTTIGDTQDVTTIGDTQDVTTIGDTQDVTTVPGTLNVTTVSDTADVTAVSDTLNVATMSGTVDVTAVSDTADVTAVSDTLNVATMSGTVDVTTVETQEQDLPLDLRVQRQQSSVSRDQDVTRMDVQSGSSNGASNKYAIKKDSELDRDEKTTRMSTSPTHSGSETEQSSSSTSALSTGSSSSRASLVYSDGEHSTDGNANIYGNCFQKFLSNPGFQGAESFLKHSVFQGDYRLPINPVFQGDYRLPSDPVFQYDIGLRNNLKIEARPRSPRPHPYSMAAILGPTNDRNASKPFTAKSSTEAEVTQMHYGQGMSSMHAWYNPAPTSGYFANQARMLPVVVWPEKARASPTVMSWCHCCRKFLSNIHEVILHQQMHHHNKDECVLQRDTFNQYGYVTQHVYIDGSTLQCSICKKIRVVYLFGKHQLSHDGHVCKLCNKECKSASSLNDHVNNHNGETPYDCTKCRKKFQSKKARAQHERCHTNEDRYRCSYCNKPFNKKYTMIVHERRHTGEYPYACRVTGCDKAYPQKVQLQNHVMKYHPVRDA